jgi:transposase
VAVHDGWAPYRGYDQMTHQLCNAHHIRELAAVAEQGPHQDWAAHLIELLCDAADRVAAARAAGQDALPAEVAAGLRARYAGHLQQGREANPRRASVSGRRVTQPKAVNLLDRLDRYRDDVLRFRTDFRVPFTNNLAEQAVRMVKLAQKISGCWRTLAGGQAFCKTRSYIATARKHGVNPLDALRQAFTGTPWMPPTTGPPPALA